MSKHGNGDYDFGPFEDDYRGYDMQGDESARGPLILALAIGVLLVFGAVVWNTYRQGVRPATAAVPTIVADTGPYKRAPETAGSAAPSDTEKRFFDQMDGSERADPPTLATATVESDVLQGGPPIELRPQDAAAGSDPSNGVPNAVAAQVQELENLSGTQTGPATAPTAALGAVPAAATQPVAPVEAAPSAAFAFADRGAFLVQIAAYRSQEAAEQGWAKASGSKPELFRGAGKRIQRADLGAKGVFYRLRVGEFQQRTEAAAFCEALKSAGDNCIVVGS